MVAASPAAALVRVLIVDDDSDDQLLTRDALADVVPPRYQVDCERTYEGALARLREHQHDVVLLDYRLGARDGLELLDEAARLGVSAPIILLTGQGTREIDEAALERGAADFLVKSQLTPDLLDRSIRYALAQRRLAERSLELAAEQAARELAEATNRTREQVIALVAHDVRNPMTVLKGHLALLLRLLAGDRPVDPAVIISSLQDMEIAVNATVHLVDDLADSVTSPAGSDAAMLRESVDLVGLAQQQVRLFGHQTSAQAVRLQTLLETLVGNWDRARLERVLANLLSNALKFSPNGGEVVVVVERKDGQACLTVQDQGIGIPEKDLPHVLDPFYRASNAAGKVAGTGLGLAGAYRIVLQHGGTMQIRSQEGQGTTVTIQLPLA